MTASVEDIYGWGSVESIKHHAQRWAWCVRHRWPYQAWWFTGGPVYGCHRCQEEKDTVYWHDPLPYWRLLKP